MLWTTSVGIFCKKESRTASLCFGDYLNSPGRERTIDAKEEGQVSEGVLHLILLLMAWHK